RLVAVVADARDDRRDLALERAVRGSIPRKHARQTATVRRVDDLQSSALSPQPSALSPQPSPLSPQSYKTILLSGYSTIPCAFALFSFGIRSRTVRSSMIVLTATHSSSLSAEIVGRCSAGS